MSPFGVYSPWAGSFVVETRMHASRGGRSVNGDEKRYQRPIHSTQDGGLTLPPLEPSASRVSRRQHGVTAQTMPLYREKVEAVGQLLTSAGVSNEDKDRQERVSKVFSFYGDIQRLQRSGHSERPQKMLTARFELGRQFEPDQLRRLEGCSVMLAIAFAAYVEQVLVAKTACDLTRAETQAREFILQMNRERGLLK